MFDIFPLDAPWQSVRQKQFTDLCHLSENDVHVWLLDISAAGYRERDFLITLDANERERAGGYRFPDDRTRFITRRVLQRMILGAYLSVSPQQVKFRHAAGAKPQLYNDNKTALEFNLSFSQNEALLAISKNTVLGVDLEQPQAGRALDLVAKENFTENEHELFHGKVGPEWLQVFYVLWTRKEAMLKAIGQGLSLSPLLLETTSDAAPVQLKGAAADFRSDTGWYATTFSTAGGAIASIVTEGKEPRLSFFRLSQNETI